jgi:predicted ATP-dependent serine protease
LGKCPACGEWNSFTEEVIKKPTQAEVRENEWKSTNIKSIDVTISTTKTKSIINETYELIFII